MVEVELTSNDCNMIIHWYVRVYGKSEKKAGDEEMRLLSKLETMRDALMNEESNFDKLTK